MSFLPGTKNREVYIFVVFCLFLILMMFSEASSAAPDEGSDGVLKKLTVAVRDQAGNAWPVAKGLDKEINPHWDKTQCVMCHEDEAGLQSGEVTIDNKDQSCHECHAEDVRHKYIHPSGLVIPEDYRNRVEKYWDKKLNLEEDEKIECSTCHNVLDQCLPNRSYMSRLNPKFLRGGPYSKRHEICYRCHDANEYKAMSSHDQIDANGNLKLNKCRLCHVVQDEKGIKKGIVRKLKDYPLLTMPEEDRSLFCLRCHEKIDHPTSAFKFTSINEYRHFIKITDKKKKTLDEMKIETGIDLPLEPVTDRIYCGTCHEAHEPGVFAGAAIDSNNPVPSHRLRVKKICVHCHDK